MPTLHVVFYMYNIKAHHPICDSKFWVKWLISFTFTFTGCLYFEITSKMPRCTIAICTVKMASVYKWLAVKVTDGSTFSNCPCLYEFDNSFYSARLRVHVARAIQTANQLLCNSKILLFPFLYSWWCLSACSEHSKILIHNYPVIQVFGNLQCCDVRRSIALAHLQLS